MIDGEGADRERFDVGLEDLQAADGKGTDGEGADGHGARGDGADREGLAREGREAPGGEWSGHSGCDGGVAGAGGLHGRRVDLGQPCQALQAHPPLLFLPPR